MKRPLYRIQDTEGRGPYRPGTSHIWTDFNHSLRNPTFMQEFGQSFTRKIRRGEHVGCAFTSLLEAEEWFSAREIYRLRMLGFRFVSISDYRILEQSKRQTIFASKKPLWLCGVRLEVWPHERSAA